MNKLGETFFAFFNVQCRLRSLVAFSLVASLSIIFASQASAQSDWIRRIDENRNGYIEPNEISDRARSYLERFARDYGIDLSRPNPVGRIEDASRRYRDRRDQQELEDVGPMTTSTVKGFGVEADATPLPGFGDGIIRYKYNQDDLNRADDQLRRSDRNRDGILTADEIAAASWTETTPAESDLNRDGQLNRIELAQRYARRRLLEQRAAIVASIPAPLPTTAPNSDSERYGGDASRARRLRGSDRGSQMLAYSVVERYDINKDGSLDQREMTRAGFDLNESDYNRDGAVEMNELAEYLLQEQEREGNDLAELLPTWFFELDRNQDGQIEMDEFTDAWDNDKLAEFNSYDTDGDGIVTTSELLTSKTLSGGAYANDKAMVLLPRSIVVSEIDVNEDIKIGSLAVQLSITHTFVDNLDAYLTGPDGQRIELFSHVGGSDDHFENTIFDDRADINITRGRPPYQGRFQPSALVKREKSLSAFNGKSIKGVWQLMVRSSRSERSGILHGWSLILTPDRDTVDRLPTAIASEPATTSALTP